MNNSEVSSNRRPPLHPDVLIRAGFALGAVMIALAFVWVNLFRQRDLLQALQLGDVWHLFPGAAAGMLFALLVWSVGRRLKAAQQIAVLLEQTLDLSAMTFRHVLLFSLLAALPEELLFRGALQPEVGLLLAAAIFGGLHALTALYFLYATGAGLFLGALALASGSLWLPIGAHFAIDLVMFFLLIQRRNHIF